MSIFIFIFARVIPLCVAGSCLAYRWYWRISAVEKVTAYIIGEKIIWADVKGFRLVKFVVQYSRNSQVYTTESLEIKMFWKSKSNSLSQKIKGQLCKNGRVSCNDMWFYEILSLLLLGTCFV